MTVQGHDGVEELLGAYALDAVDADEADRVERHLAVCARCRAEVAEHREVASLLAYPGAAAPGEVWDRIAGKLQEPPPPLRLMPGGALPASRRQVVVRRLMAGAVAALIAVVAVLGVDVARLNRKTSRLPQVWSAQARRAAWQVALTEPGARRVTLRSPDGQRYVDGVVLPGGASLLGPTNLAALSPDHSYQLWGIVGSDRISLGVLGADPAYQSFSTPAAASALAITVEREGGAIAPTTTPAALAVLRRT